MRSMINLGVAAWMLLGSALFASEPAELGPYSFLIGEWVASDSGHAGAGAATFTRGLQDRIIMRTSYTEIPAGNGRPASRHDDLMIIYAGRDGVQADYYDNEGHVIRYTVQSPAPGEAVFLSEVSPAESRFRLSYKLEPTGILKGEFAMAFPGALEEFKPYLQWETCKATGSGK